MLEFDRTMLRELTTIDTTKQLVLEDNVVPFNHASLNLHAEDDNVEAIYDAALTYDVA